MIVDDADIDPDARRHLLVDGTYVFAKGGRWYTLEGNPLPVREIAGRMLGGPCPVCGAGGATWRDNGAGGLLVCPPCAVYRNDLARRMYGRTSDPPCEAVPS